MGIKFSSIVLLILAVFIVKISLENFGQAQAQENKLKTKSDIQNARINTSKNS